MHESSEKLGVVAVTRGLVQQSDDGVACATRLGLEIRVELVGDGEPGIQRDGPNERVLGAAVAVGRGVDELADHSMTPSEVCPGGCKVRVDLEALLVQRTGAHHPLIGARKLIRSEI